MGKKPRTKFYTVWIGRKPGVYDSWGLCQTQVVRFPGAKYKAFKTFGDAQVAFLTGWKKYYGKKAETKNFYGERTLRELMDSGVIEKNGYACDASCIKNPGVVEYRTVSLADGKIILHKKINHGTNNLGEFLGIVHSLAHFKKNHIKTILYCDSATAIGWVKKKKIASKLPMDSRSKEIWELAHRALDWLKKNDYDTILKKWDTKHWGEIPADFGRK